MSTFEDYYIALVDTNELPVHLALTLGEAYDNRLCSVLPQARCFHKRCFLQIVDTTRIGSGRWPASKARGPMFRRKRNRTICFSPFLYRSRNSIEWLFNKIKQCRSDRRDPI